MGKYELDWVRAKLLCQSYGMEMLTPHSESDSRAFSSLWEEVRGLPKSIHIGLTMKGTNEEKWYNAHSGKVVDFDLDWEKTQSVGVRECMSLENYPRGALGYYDGECNGHKRRFICQKDAAVAKAECKKIDELNDFLALKLFVFQ